MLSSALLYFNVFLMLVNSSPQDINTLLTKLEDGLNIRKRLFNESIRGYNLFDYGVKCLTDRINTILKSHGKSINRYIVNEVIPLIRRDYGDYLTNDKEKWVYRIRKQEEIWRNIKYLTREIDHRQAHYSSVYIYLFDLTAVFDVYLKALALHKNMKNIISENNIQR
ncbi:hypothetical protein KSF78_0009286 [Schistosoma japonicum]|nr:hypothetical protein KSF78_0009286 [Schistosoma japonicum]